jgi:RimJ/RimL family protein N-acetyltransferase
MQGGQRSLKSKQSFIVREANENDAEAINNIVDSVASEKYYVVPEESGDWIEIIREMRNRNGLVIVALVNDKPVGIACLARGKFEKNKHVAFLGIAITKEFRRMGIGTAMMNHLLAWTRKQEGVEKISLSVFSTNKPAINMYRNLGFETEGISKRQYKIEGKYVDEVTMGKSLA